MNKLVMIIMFVFAFGLIASSALAEEGMNASLVKNNTLPNYDGLSPAEFFYGVSINHNNETIGHAQAYRTEKPESDKEAFSELSPQEFFGYSAPARHEGKATDNGIFNTAVVSHTAMSDISNPANFFGYTDATNEGGCSNC